MAPESEDRDAVSATLNRSGIDATEKPKKDKKDNKSKKRKLETPATEELEIDLSLPEPQSKKAARKAKKQKLSKDSSNAKPAPSPAQPTSNGPAVRTTQQHQVTEEPKPKHYGRSLFAIWIGNLPYHATKSSLTTFLTSHGPTITPERITRIHMPAPDAPSHRMYKNDANPMNKGFAYVDFDGLEALEAAMELSEMPFEEGGRRVLIKSAWSFEGRPDPSKSGAGAKSEEGAKGLGLGLGLDKMNVQKPPSKRVFVGNLPFDTSREELERHYSQCGDVIEVRMATFEDTGKCKGYAWVTFGEGRAAEAAVKGFVLKEQDDDEEGGEGKKKKPRKWFVNKLRGRDLKVEFAEAPEFRYRKRFGGETRSKKYSDERRRDDDDIQAEEYNELRKKDMASGKAGQERREKVSKVWKPSTKPTAKKSDPPQATGAIVEAKGKKITFD